MARRNVQAAPCVGASMTKSDEGVSVVHSTSDALHGRFRRELQACGVTRSLTEAEFRLLDVFGSLIDAKNVTPGESEPFVWISQSDLQREADLGRAAVQIRIKSLIDKRVLRIAEEGIGQDSAIYVLQFAANRIGPSQTSPRGRFKQKIEQLRGEQPAFDPSLFESDNLSRGLPTEAPARASEAFENGMRGLPTEAPARASEAFENGMRGLPANAPARASEARADDKSSGDTLLGSLSIALCSNAALLPAPAPAALSDVAAAATACAGNSECKTLLLAQHFDEGAAIYLAAHPNCTVGQIRIGIQKADWYERKARAKGLKPGDERWPSRQGIIRTAIIEKWKGWATAEQRREASKPECVQEDNAMQRERQAIEAKEAARVRAALAVLDAGELRARIERQIEIEPSDAGKTLWRKRLGLPLGQIPDFPLKGLLLAQPVYGPGYGGKR